jgi:ABC-2 type transport system ATP-binding protein
MSKVMMRTTGLTKSYRSGQALSDVSITLEAGKIYGLIGQNGAGKTTLMRLIAGLAFPTGGSLELFGVKGEHSLREERRRMGALIEAPSLTPGLNARDNLRLHRIIRGIPNEEMEQELLELVGLSHTGKKKVKDFSLGMKQRLGIAISLLGNPELLLLDEPVNGLDPIGVVDIRHLLLQCCEERQMTILISSHNLPELVQTATDFILIHQGHIKQTLTATELEERCRRHLLLSSTEPERLVSVLEMELKTASFKVMPDQTVRLYDYLDDKEQVARVLAANGVVVTTLASSADTLEDYFIAAVGGVQS